MVYSTSSIALSDTSYLLDFVELVQRLDRGQRVDVEALDLIADLHEDMGADGHETMSGVY